MGAKPALLPPCGCPQAASWPQVPHAVPSLQLCPCWVALPEARLLLPRPCCASAPRSARCWRQLSCEQCSEQTASGAKLRPYLVCATVAARESARDASWPGLCRDTCNKQSQSMRRAAAEGRLDQRGEAYLTACWLFLQGTRKQTESRCVLLGEQHKSPAHSSEKLTCIAWGTRTGERLPTRSASSRD